MSSLGAKTLSSGPICQFANTCSGCSQWGPPLARQQEQKVTAFKNEAENAWGLRLPPIKVHDLGPSGLRDRLDFTLSDGKLGLLEKPKGDSPRPLVDLPVCLQLSPELQDFLTEFRKDLPTLKSSDDPSRNQPRKGSVRLRVNPEGLRGIWLDFSHQDIQNLFASQIELKKLLNMAYVEVGQRRKKLYWDETSQPGRLRLSDPELHPWTSTFSGSTLKPDPSIPLYCYVSSFTQTGLTANRKIAEVIDNFVSPLEPQSIFEFGSGAGTLTLPALLAMPKDGVLTVFENDPLTLEGLKLTLTKNSLSSRVNIITGDFQKKNDNQILAKNHPEMLLLNPPRSGVGAFLDEISVKTKSVIYMSCFAESLIKDAQKLINHGFKPTRIELIDQFPQTTHGEWLTLWTRSQ